MDFRTETILIPASSKPRLVIIGSGFGGIELARKLRNGPFQVIMLDRYNYHTFQPLLYQVATAGLEPDSIAGPIRDIFEGAKDFFFRLATVEKIAADQKTLFTNIGSLSYDVLVIANGSKTNYFGNEELRKRSFPLKQIPHALDMRSNILQCFERAVLTSDIAERKSLMNFVVVGGGPTGVELAGALSELKNHVMPSDYPELDFSEMKICLIEGSPRLLNGMSEQAGKKALDYLHEFGVETKLNMVVKSYDGHTVLLGDGSTLNSQTLIWAAGVYGNLIDGLPTAALGPGNRIKVDAFLKVESLHDVYAIGDIASLISPETPKGHPMVAPVAMQQGQLVAKNLLAVRKNKAPKPFKYFDKGSMATIGRNKAVVDMPGGIRFQGIFAWFVWMFVHLLLIAGFRNKLVIFTNWVWNYFTYNRGTRLIIRPHIKNKEPVVENLTVL